jgi:putative chitinase
MSITAEQLQEAFDLEDGTAEKYIDALNAAMDEFEINTPQRRAMFLAQCCHESGHFRAVSENLNYKADSLSRVFPKYFKDVDPNDYAKQPEKIANRVYGNRMGNGDDASGDGYRFRGRGLIQLTGKSNYVACSEDLEVDLIENPDYLLSPEGAARSAAWFWDSRDLNDLADAGDVVGATKKINGGTIGLEERTELYEDALKTFGA